MNRIAQAIEKMEAKLKGIPTEKLDKLDHTMQENLSSLVAYQNAQSFAFASGNLTADEAQALYRIYGGECPSAQAWAKQSLAARVVATKAAGELLGAQIATRRS